MISVTAMCVDLCTPSLAPGSEHRGAAVPFMQWGQPVSEYFPTLFVACGSQYECPHRWLSLTLLSV
jgi:hypothetical protein